MGLASFAARNGVAIDRYRFTGKGVQTAADDGVVMSLSKGALRTVA